MKKFLVAVLLLASMSVMAQKKEYSITKDSATGCLVFNGVITINDLDSEPTFNWMKAGFDEYKPNEQITGYLQQNLPQYSMVVFLGTWCDDSHYWVPKLVKLLKTINYPTDKLTMYGVDRDKTTGTGESAKYNMKWVPTIIVLKDGKEVGRITESAKNGLEADLQEIIMGK